MDDLYSNILLISKTEDSTAMNSVTIELNDENAVLPINQLDIAVPGPSFKHHAQTFLDCNTQREDPETSGELLASNVHL